MNRRSRSVLIIVALAGVAALFAGTPTVHAGDGYYSRSYVTYRGYCPPPVYRTSYCPPARVRYVTPRRYTYPQPYVYARGYAPPRAYVRTGRHYRKYGYFYPYCR